MNLRSNKHKTSTPSSNRARRVIAAGLLAFLPYTAYAGPADDSFASGKTAFKEGFYLNAAEHFERALTLGHPRGPTTYNLGVALYRAQNYRSAEDAFLRASEDPKFAPLAFYNLGLVAKKLGNDRDARIWFNQTRRHRDASQELRKLASKAINSLPGEVAAVRRPDEPKLTDHLRVSMQSGYGSDSNVYRSPAESYVDLGDPTTPTIDPVVQSGSYVPVDATSEIRWGLREDSYFKIRYDFSGKFYSDAELKNANEMIHRVHVGGVLDQDTRRGSRYWSSRFVWERYEQEAYDRDTGDEQLVGAEDVTDRLNFTKMGPRIYYDRRWRGIGWGFKGSAYIRNYDETLDFLDLTNEQYQAGVHFSYYPWRSTRFRIEAEGSNRTYANRVAKDIAGIRFTDNDPLEYDYLTAGISVRQRLMRGIYLKAEGKYTDRADVFEGYDDYTRYFGRLSLDVRRGRFSGYASYGLRQYDFPNAFVFDDPTLELRTLDTSFIEFEAEYAFTDHFGVYVHVEKDLVESNDPRSAYDRTTSSLSLRWRL